MGSTVGFESWGSMGRRTTRRLAMLLCVCAAALFGAVTSAGAANTAAFSGASPATGAAVAVKPSVAIVTADDTAPVFSATARINGALPSFVGVDHPVGHMAWDEDAESYVWVVDDWSVVKIVAYLPANRIVSGLNTLVYTVNGVNGASTYTTTFTYSSAPTVSSVLPVDGAVLASAPTSVSAAFVSAGSSFTSTMTIDGVAVATAFDAGTKTYRHTPGSPLSAGKHAVVFTVRDAQGGTTTKSWTFNYRPPMSTGEECSSCHTTFPAAHPLNVCQGCHTAAFSAGHGAFQVAAGFGCVQSDCHQLDHGGPIGRGIALGCTDCHNAAYPRVARHTDASTTAAHASSNPTCTRCHAGSLIDEHAKYPAGTSDKYQCVLCHGPSAPAAAKAAVLAGDTNCVACHGTSADHEFLHATTVPGSCAGASCHTGTSLTGIHEVPGCAGCHASVNPAVVGAIATGDKKCVTCHPGDPHPVAVHTAGGPCVTSGCHAANVTTLHAPGPACAACHAAGKTPTLVCSTCHTTSTLHLTAVAKHTSGETCDSCHVVANLVTIHADNCALCHPTPATGMTWNKRCSSAGCHPTSHKQFTTHRGEHDGNGYDCWDCHDVTLSCRACHSVYDRALPVTTSNAVAAYTGTATIKLTPTDTGGSGIRATYYQVDGGPLMTGTTIVVAAPATGVKSHTIEFWSTDKGYNTEAHKRATFTVSAP